MKRKTGNVAALALILVATIATTATAASDISVVGASGYDLVAYHTEMMPVKGLGYHVTVHEGTTYAFSTEENLKLFKENPEKFLPQFGGYCAYGVSVGKKFVADPLVWHVEDGRLYFNLDKDIQKQWNKDLKGNIRKGRQNWDEIRYIDPSKL